MSAFTSFALFTAGLVAVASAAITVPGGSDPTGPAVYQPGLADVVPVGEDFMITWSTKDTADCGATVDFVLLHGASAATMQAVSYIAQGVNTTDGTYAWSPSKDLAPATTGYGIELICVKNNAYQYTDQFGIANADYVAPSSSSSASSSASTSALSSYAAASASSSVRSSSTTVKPIVYTTEVVTSYTTYCPEATQFAVNNKTYSVSEATTLTITDCPCTVTKAMNQTAVATSAVVSPVTGYAGNSSVIKPTGNMTVPHTLKTSTASLTASTDSAVTATSSSSSSPAVTSSTQSGSAANVGASLAGLVIAAGVAVFAL